MTSNLTLLPEGLARRKQLLFVALAGMVATVGVLLLFWLGAGFVSAQESAPKFNPSVKVLVPVDLPLETVFTVSYEPVAGSDSGCVAVENHRYRTKSAGNRAKTYYQPALVRQPAGVAELCEYDVMWPEIEGLALHSDSTDTVSYTSSSNSVYGVKVVGIYDSVFSPEVNVSLPVIFSGTASYFAEASFTVSYTAQSGSDGNCTASASETYVVNDDGDAEVSGVAAVLVDRPALVSERCSYDIGWPAGVEGLGIRSGSVATVDATYSDSDTEGAISVIYDRIVSSDWFYHDVTLEVPNLDADNEGNNDYTNEVFVVSFGRYDYNDYSTITNDCNTGTERNLVGHDGSVTVIGPRIVLRKYSSNRSTNWLCEYSASYDHYISYPAEAEYGSSQGYNFLWDRIDGKLDSENISHTLYFHGRFEPGVFVTVPQVDTDGDGINDFSGAEFLVKFNSMAHFGFFDPCPTKILTRTYRVNDSGTAVATSYPGWFSDIFWHSSREAQYWRCSYTVDFPASVSHANGSNTQTLYLQTRTLQYVNAVRGLASATYSTTHTSSGTTFSPGIDIVIPQVDDKNGNNWYDGVRFPISYTGSGAGCTESASETYVVDNDGSVNLSGAAAVLVYIPADTTQRCRYGISHGAVEGLGSRRLEQSRALFDSPVRISYAWSGMKYYSQSILFSPDITISVPQIDADDNNSNDFSGTNLRIDFSSVADSDEKCTTSASETYKILANGNTNMLATSSSVYLVDQPYGKTSRCSYDVTYSSIPPENTPETGRFLMPRAGLTTNIDAVNLSIEATFIEVFKPAVTILVPKFIESDGDGGEVNVFAGTSFSVSYSKSNNSATGCTPSASETYLVDDDREAELSGAAAVLIVRPADAATSTRCSYVVGWPEVVGWALSPGATATVDGVPTMSSGAVGVVSASYFDGFYPDVTIGVPQIVDGDKDNVFSSVSFSVGYVPVSDSDDGCTASASEVYVVDDEGGVELSGADAGLVDIPVGETASEQCSYDVVVSVPAGKGLLADGAAGFVISDSAKSGSVSYLSRFTPDVTVEVPQFVESDGDGNEVNVFSGTSFVVSYAKSGTPAAGCTASASETYVVDDDGEVELSGAAAALVDRPDGATVGTRCSYLVSWPEVDGWVLSPGATVSVDGVPDAVSGDVGEVSASYYDGFYPDVTIGVPQVDDAAGDNIFEGADFSVSYAKVSGPATGCTSSASETYEVDDEGSAVLTGAAAGLVDRPAGAAASVTCSYAGTVSVGDGNGLRVQGLDSFKVRDARRAGSVSFAGTFALEVTVSVPAHFVSETRIEVSYIPVANSNSGCDAVRNHIYKLEVSDNGSEDFRWPLLVDRPAGAAMDVRCSYKVVWHDKPGLVLNASTGPTVSATSNTATATYIDGFYPDVTIKVPAVDVSPAGGDGVNDFAGEVLSVSYSPVTGSNDDCTASASANYVVASDGTVAPQMVNGVKSRAGLVDRPADAAEGVSCVYDVTWPEVTGQHRLSDASATVRDSSTNISAKYYNVFLPGSTIQVPQISGTGDTNIFSGYEFELSYVRTSASDTNCVVSGADTFKVDTDGTVIRKPGSPVASLRGYIGGVAAACAYNVQFPEQVESSAQSEDLVLKSPDMEEEHIVRFNKYALASYYSVFSPSVRIYVPNINFHGEGENSLSGTKIKASYTVLSGLDAGCTSKGSEDYTVADNGSVGPPDGSDGDRAILIDTPVGSSERCSYDVSFPVAVGDALGLQYSDDSKVVSATSTPPIARYQLLSRFQPVVTIKLAPLNDEEGAHVLSRRVLKIVFERRQGQIEVCSSKVTGSYTIDDNGNFAVTGLQPQLVERQPGNRKKCKYDVTYNLNTTYGSGDTQSGLALQSGATKLVTFSSNHVSVTYSYGFSPGVNISVPQFNVGGTNAFAGATFSARFARKGSASNLCTELDSVEYSVATDGTVSLSGEILYLVSHPLVDNTQTPQEGDYMKGTACAYKVKKPVVINSDNLALVNSGFADINHQSGATGMTYYSVFVPDVSFVIPYSGDLGSDHAFFDAKFEVIFEAEPGNNTRCTELGSQEQIYFKKYKVGADGSVTAKGTDIRLVDNFILPTGSTEPSQRCTYSVEFPSTVTSKTSDAHKLVRRSVSTNTIGAEMRVEVSYVAEFIPEVVITIPQLDEDGDGDNDFSGVRFFVSFVSEQEASSGCSPTTRLMYRAQDDGTVQLAEEAEQLVDRIDATSSCSYRVSVVAYSNNRLVRNNEDNEGDSDESITVEGASPQVSLTFVEAPEDNEEE